MIKSKQFKAIVKARRQYLLGDWKPETFSHSEDWLLLYLKYWYPDRLAAYEHALYLMSVNRKESDIYRDILDRFQQLAMLSTVNDIIKVLQDWREISFSNKVTILESLKTNRALYNPKVESLQILNSPLVNNYRKSQDYMQVRIWCHSRVTSVPRSVTGLMTSKFFKLTHAEMSLRPLEVVFSWIATQMVTQAYYKINFYELVEHKHKTKKALLYAHKCDPVYFMLLNRVAKLLMP